MVKLTFVEHSGERYILEVPKGTSVMEAATNNGLPNVIGECGGVCACATCHIYIDQDWLNRVGPPGETESEMLELAIDPNESSRLGCQIIMSDELDGLIVSLPTAQT